MSTINYALNNSLIRGDRVSLFDRNDYIDVMVINRERVIYKVLDKQGFIHLAELTMDEHGLFLKSLVSPVDKQKAGYCPKIQKKLNWTNITEAIASLAERERKYSY